MPRQYPPLMNVFISILADSGYTEVAAGVDVELEGDEYFIVTRNHSGGKEYEFVFSRGSASFSPTGLFLGVE